MPLYSMTSTVHRLAKAVALAPSDRPAHELPEYEPTAADLAALELATDDELDDHFARIATFCAIEHHSRELFALRNTLGIDGRFSEPDEDHDLPLTA